MKLPDGDVLIHCGDATGLGSLNEFVDFNRWMSEQPHKYKIFVAGNHDWLAYRDHGLATQILQDVIYLRDSMVEIEGKKFYGSPWTPEFGNWAFMSPREKLAERWKLIPEKVDVLITHGPPHGILDGVVRWGEMEEMVENVGCEELRWEVLHRVKPRYHVFGHIHGGYGVKTLNDETVFMNVSCCDEDYDPVNPPKVFYL